MTKFLPGKRWGSPFKQLHQLMLIVGAMSVLWFVVSWILGFSPSISWEVIAQGETIPVTLDTLQIGPFKLPVVIDGYLISERFHGSPLQLHIWPSYVLLMLIALVFVILLSFITTLSRFWYMTGMGLVVVFLMSFQMEHLSLFGRHDKIALIIAFVLFLPLSYYFHSIRSNTKFRVRLIGFSGAIVLFALLIHFYAEVTYPYLYLATYGYTAPVVLACFFILLVGAELPTAVIWLLSSAKTFGKGGNNIGHFLIVAGLYVLNLLLIFLHDVHYLSWELEFISPFLLLVIAAVIGWFTYKNKEELYGSIYSYAPTGAIVYLALAALSFATIGFHIFSANDSIVNVFKKVILYSQLGYGFMFIVYVIGNFISPLGQGLPVFKILYRPPHMPYFTFRFAGTVTTLAFFLLTNYKVHFYAALSSYYNGIGDLHVLNNEDKVAEAYYINGNSYGYNTHRSSYALASLALKNNDKKAEAHYYGKAIRKRASEQAYINLSNAYYDNNQPFEAIFTLQDALKEFPHSNRIKTNLGLLHYKVSEIDSAFLLTLEARNSNVTASTAGVNMLQFIAKGEYAYNVDSITNAYANREYLAANNNIKVLYNLNQEYDDGLQVRVDSSLNLLTAYELYNAEVNKVFGNDTLQADYMLDLARRWENNQWKEMLLLGGAMGHYYNGNVSEAFKLIELLAQEFYQSSGYHYNLLGLLALEQGAPRLAVDFFKNSLDMQFEEAQLNLAIALSEAQLSAEAIQLWDSIALSAYPLKRNIANEMLSFYNSEKANTNAARYWNWYYVASKNNEMTNELAFDSITDADYKNLLLLNLVQFHLEQGNASTAQFIFDRIINVQGPDMNRYNSLALQLACINKDQSFLKKNMPDSALHRENTPAWNYYKMCAAWMDGDTTAANALIPVFKNKNPFIETAVIALANYYNENQQPFEAYDVLLKAIEVNKYSVALLKAYIMQCAKMDFDTYAQYELERLRELVSSVDYQNALERYKAELENTRLRFHE